MIRTAIFGFTRGATRSCRSAGSDRRASLALSVLLAALLAGCGSGSDGSGDEVAGGNGQGSVPLASANLPGTTIPTATSAASSLPDKVAVTDFIVVGSSRTGRTTMRYELKLKLSNNAADAYQNVMATLVSAPSHISIINPSVAVGDLPGNSTILSSGTFTIDVDLAVSTSFDDLVWQIDGDVTSPPAPPPSGNPTRAGYFMNIDGNAIKGESTSESHRDWIELNSIRGGLQLVGVPSGSAGGGRSSYQLSTLEVSKFVDLSSPPLRRAIAEGTIFGEVRIEDIRSCGGKFYTALAITLTAARLESLSAAASAGDRSTEELGFNYTRIETMYTPVGSKCQLLPPVFSTQDGSQLNI